MVIRAEPRVGYEIDAGHIPELNRRLTDKILMALNLARASNELEVASHLQTALDIAEMKREKWLKQHFPG
jgi:hypothetical protein